jgi:hypothetical protein
MPFAGRSALNGSPAELLMCYIDCNSFFFSFCRKPMTWNFKWGKFVQKDFEGRGYLQVLIGKVDPVLRLQKWEGVDLVCMF